MKDLDDQLAAPVSAALAASPGADPVAVAALLLGPMELEDRLHQAFDGLSPTTRALVVAHGAWPRFESDATALAGLEPEAAALALVELQGAGWVDGERRFGLAVRAWRRARLTPPAAMTARAAAHAEACFHRLRCAGAGDVAARERLDHWCAWSTAPEVAQWGDIAREAHLGDAACARCEAWDAIEQSRAAQWRGWEDQASRWLDRAEAAARSDRARFFVQFLRAIRAVSDVGAGAAVQQLRASVPAEEEWVFVHQAEAVLAQAERRDPRPPLRRGVGLAQRLAMPFREAHLRLLLALAEWPDGPAMRAELEPIELGGLRLSPRDHWNFRWAFARAHLASDDLQTAASHARDILDDPATAALNPGGPWALVAIAERCAGREQPARAALVQARRFLTRDSEGPLRDWLERAWRDGSVRPLPRMAFAHPPPAYWARRDGTRFCVGDREVDLSRSPVSVALLRALAHGPHATDALIAACWPGDASSYPSLRNRLHSALRMLRRRGLADHLVFEHDTYRLDGLSMVDDQPTD